MAFAKFMNKKDFHPGSKANIKRAWMAEQKTLAQEMKQKELQLQYAKEQQRFNNRQLVSKDDRIKSGLDFLYDAPPGYKKDQEKSEADEKEGELKFAWQKGAPREAYAKNLGLAAKDQPFGIPVRNVKCIKCGNWGHVNTDRECPMFNQPATTDVDALDIADPLRLLKEMRSDGLTLKQNVLGRIFDPKDPNQQILASDDDEEQDPEVAFLASLTDKQKKKLLRKLDKMEQQESDSHKSKHKKKKQKRRHSSSSEGESSEDEHSNKMRSRKASQTESQSNGERERKRRHETKSRRRSAGSNSDDEKDKKLHRKKTKSDGKRDTSKQHSQPLDEDREDRDRKQSHHHGNDNSSGRSADHERHRDRHQRKVRGERERHR